MRRKHPVNGIGIAALVALLGFGAAGTRAQIASPAPAEVVLKISPDKTTLHWTVDSALHTVHGTFFLKGGAIHFNPATGDAGGEVVAIATSGQSGNGPRDKRMHREILETAKYPEVVFRPKHVYGSVSRSGPSDVKVSGTMSIHGADHEMTAAVHAELTGDHWTGTGKFEVPYITWGMKDPSNFLLKVKPVVNIQLEMAGAVASQ